MSSPVSRGFHGRERSNSASRLPPGQYETRDFPVLSAGPTPHVPLEKWDFAVQGLGARAAPWSWDEFRDAMVLGIGRTPRGLWLDPSGARLLVIAATP